MRQVKTINKSIFYLKLLDWWELNKRDFPWRQIKNPYHLLIAEILLRKTTALQVKRLYNEFIALYPTPLCLKEANKHILIDFLKPLGMEKLKSDLLIKFGTVIVEKFNGEVPVNIFDLLSLPSVGQYSANAVLSLIYNENLPMVDTNFIRIIERVFNYKSLKSRAREDKDIWEFAKNIIPEGKSRDFNFAVLDFAAIICTARKPKCKECVFVDDCFYSLAN